MERRMMKDVVKDVQQVVALVQADEAVIIQPENGPELVLMTHKKFEELQAKASRGQPSRD